MADVAVDGFGTIFQVGGGGGGGGGGQSGEGGPVELVEGLTTLRVNRTTDEGWGTDPIGEGARNSVVLSGSGESYGAQAEGVGLLSGRSHSCLQELSVVAGGSANMIMNPDGQGPYALSAILGGNSNEIYGAFGVIGGGDDNQIGANESGADFSHYGVICGGAGNYLNGYDEGGNFGFIGGGSGNNADRAVYSFLGGGLTNVIHGGQESAQYGNALVGGGSNRIRASGYAFLGGGQNNEIGDSNEEGDISAGWAVLTGGRANEIEASFGVILGGENNFINEGSEYGVVLAGANNAVDAESGYAWGHSAGARHGYAETFASGSFNTRGEAQVTRTVLRTTSSGANQANVMGAGPSANYTDFGLDPAFTYQWTLDATISDTSASMKGVTQKGILIYEGGGWHLVPFTMPADVTYGSGVPDVNITVTTAGDAIRVTLVTGAGQTDACKAVGVLTVIEAINALV